ncbi:MAG: NADH-quinone oxidoreductase subunit J [Candidatus Eisenbacteria bacterium]|nr:NADH-quinone oxidoreductase subunit J [Candidatus Eisenbacteria bacterium]
MTILFYAAALAAIACGAIAVTRKSAMNGLVALAGVFLSTALLLWTIGAAFVAALEIIVYAGAILVLFVFAVMLLNADRGDRRAIEEPGSPAGWIVPAILVVVLLGLAAFGIGAGDRGRTVTAVSPRAVGRSLFSDYVAGVEIASFLLLAGLLAAYHFGAAGGRRPEEPGERTGGGQ